ncbi:hypothetical protein AB0M02_37470 [Actinoplanes sp. NPDC051861]|uniref:hypothetical protein n=1 Tax=Actinoplanes sp. NPDC051861 TaxID=3155170 RepID=UPI003420C33B
MTDRLDQLAEAARPLLSRVDSVLSGIGAPEGHDVWPELRRVRLLPGDAVRAVCDLSPDAIRAAAPELRAEARTYADVADSLPLPGEWVGEAAEAYEEARRRTAEHLNGGPESLARRMEMTADLADALTEWMTRARRDLALVLAEVITSAEALTLTAGTGSPPEEQARAAADVGALLLRTVADAYDRGEDLLEGSTALQNPLPA